MAKLSTIECPQCYSLLEADEYTPNARGGAPTALNYETCLRRCETCGIGLSNARTNPTAIYREPSHNVPVEVREGIYQTLDRSLNERNRANKRAKFGFSTSEDAITWTVFRFLQAEGLLKTSFKNLLGVELQTAMSEPSLLLWGVPVPLVDPGSEQVRNDLVGVSKMLGEAARARSEPDVILDFGSAGLIAIEVKYRSGNDRQIGNYDQLSKYLEGTGAITSPGIVRETGLYELARNWRIGMELAGSRPFALINLGPDDLFRKEGKRLENFRQGLAEDNNHRFLTVHWSYFLSAIPQPRPLWFDQYLMERELWL